MNTKKLIGTLPILAGVALGDQSCGISDKVVAGYDSYQKEKAARETREKLQVKKMREELDRIQKLIKTDFNECIGGLNGMSRDTWIRANTFIAFCSEQSPELKKSYDTYICNKHLSDQFLKDCQDDKFRFLASIDQGVVCMATQLTAHDPNLGLFLTYMNLAAEVRKLEETIAK